MPYSTNQFIRPINCKINEKGNLSIGGCDLVDLALKYGTPLYVIDEKTLRSICRDYKNAFTSYKNVKMMYASKALCSMATSAIIAQEGFGFDVVSAGEMYTVYKIGVDMSRVLFNGNNKSADELILAIDWGIGRISVDNFSELKLLDELAKSKKRHPEILLRITPGIECHTHKYIQTGHLESKFGFDLTQIDTAVEFILNSNLILHGLHAHIGSQIFETKVYHDEIDILVKEIARVNGKFRLKLNEINIGGGLGVKYTDKDLPPSTYDIAQVILASLDCAVKKYGVDKPVIFLEPGRSIISTAGVTLYTIGSSKQVPNGKKYFAVDGGMADNVRPSMYKAEYTALVANKPDEPASQTVTIAGRFCESGDILIEKINLPELAEGDILCVFNTGAYNYSMASNYNRVEKPAMVLVNNSQSDMIIKRDSLDDLILHDIIPDRLRSDV